MTMIFIPQTPPRPRREITRDGVRYREVLPEDDATWWQIVLVVLVFLLIVVPLCFLFLAWVMAPIMNWIFRHSPMGL